MTITYHVGVTNAAIQMSVKLFHSVAMVCDLSPCFKSSLKLQIRDQTLYSVSIVKARNKSACSSSERLHGKEAFHKLFEKTSTVRI